MRPTSRRHVWALLERKHNIAIETFIYRQIYKTSNERRIGHREFQGEQKTTLSVALVRVVSTRVIQWERGSDISRQVGVLTNEAR